MALKRKHVSISFPQSRDAAAAGVVLVFYGALKLNMPVLNPTKLIES